MSEMIWHGMSRVQLDIAYNNSAAVKNSAAKLAEWAERSARLRARKSELLGLVYGPRPRNRIDIFKSEAAGAPLIAFIHGGYWQRNSKEIFSCIAEGPLSRGMDVALIGYTLAPEATLTEIVEEVRTAMHWLRVKGPRFGIARNAIIASGWSAGGHLTAMVLPEADAGLAISGIFDIEPCRLNYLNEKLHLTADEVLMLSPMRKLGKESKRLTIAFGVAELPELQRQSRDYYAARQNAAQPAELLPLSRHNHFSILEELADPSGQLTDAAARLT